MRLHYAKAIIAAIAFSLALSAIASAQQQIRMIPCRTNDCWGGPSPEDSMTPVVGMIAEKAAGIGPLLPNDIRIEVMIVGGDEFHHQYTRGRPHLITIGVEGLAGLHNNWVDKFYEGYENVEEVFGAIVEWVLYHEIGHALQAHCAEKDSCIANDDRNHERMADRFATVAVMFANRDSAIRARYASQGIYAMSLPEGERMTPPSDGSRNAFAKAAPNKRRVSKKRPLDGLLGIHNPTPYRAWDVMCYVWGSGLGPHPGDHEGTHQGQPAIHQCNEHDFNNAVWELNQYVPALPKVELDRVLHYNPETRRLFYP